MFQKAFLFAFALLLLSPTLCAAENGRARDAFKGDIFNNAIWVAGNRPAVRSDRARGTDMFAPIPVYLNRNADLFAGMPNQRYAIRSDMFGPSRTAPLPPNKIFHVPFKDKPYGR